MTVAEPAKPALAPLSDRVTWLCRKAMAYLERRGNLLDELADLASVRAGGSDDPEALADALGDSQVFDVLLHRCGWFEQFLPRQMDEAEAGAAIDALIAETGAASVKDMGRVMALIKERHAGQLDMSKASQMVKAKLS